ASDAGAGGPLSLGDPSGAEAGSAISRLAPPSVRPSPAKPGGERPPPLGRVIGNRDFVVTVACHEEAVVVTPGGATFAWPAQGDGKDIDAALVQTISQLVARRQATVRAGEPPYRPVLRFLVHDGGRRTYHHVYPLLERLRFAMVREDVQED
ncbi:MAG: hypothetical protein NZO58_06400, partial [Gemmataceae bacterium]|nr:hypothetical protein [Gemmataceae bacterium]